MKKYLFAAALPLLFCGCLVVTTDPAADRAAAAYGELQQFAVKNITLEEALQRAGTVAEKLRMRRYFAMYLWSKESKMPAAVEQWRVRLNSALGFLPETTVEYSGEKFSACPDEIPTVESSEKAAIIIADGRAPLPELLCKVRIAHVNAVTAMNQWNRAKTPGARIFYLNNCLDLAEIIGVDLPELNDLENYEKRFDAAAARRQKARLNGK